MKIYVQNICWGFSPYEVTEEEISNLPTTATIEIDMDLVENTEDIKLYYTEDVDKLTDDRFQLEEFDWSFLGYNLDVTQKITVDTYLEEKREAEELLDYEEEIKRWHSDMRRG